MMTWDAEVRQKILALNPPPQIVEDEQSIICEIEASFAFSGSKIDWSTTFAHQQCYWVGGSPVI